MDTLELRHKLLEYINSADDRVLRIVNAVFESYQNEDVVAHTIDGKAISKAEYIERNKQAVEAYKNGQFKTQDQILEKYQKS